MNEEEIAKAMEERIITIPDYPKPGVLFRDITPLLKDTHAFRLCINQFKEKLKNKKIDYIVGIEARGFIVGSALAYSMGIGFIPARKEGKLVRDKVSMSYALEYGNATLEMHADSVEKGKNVLIVDDLLATGGTARAVGDIVRKLGGKVIAFAFLIELTYLNGKEKLRGDEVISLVKY